MGMICQCILQPKKPHVHLHAGGLANLLGAAGANASPSPSPSSGSSPAASPPPQGTVLSLQALHILAPAAAPCMHAHAHMCHERSSKTVLLMQVRPLPALLPPTPHPHLPHRRGCALVELLGHIYFVTCHSPGPLCTACTAPDSVPQVLCKSFCMVH